MGIKPEYNHQSRTNKLRRCAASSSAAEFLIRVEGFNTQKLACACAALRYGGNIERSGVMWRHRTFENERKQPCRSSPDKDRLCVSAVHDAKEKEYIPRKPHNITRSLASLRFAFYTGSMRIVSWNVNGIRAAEKKGFIDWLKHDSPDILCVQETKARPEQLSPELIHPPFDKADAQGHHYFSYWACAKKAGYSGTAMYSKTEPLDIELLGNDEFDNEGRVLAAHYNDFVVISAYFPNSQEAGARLPYKLAFCGAMLSYCENLVKNGKNIILCGDYNIAHTPIDLARPKENEGNAGYLPEERAWMDDFLKAGYIDTFRHFHPGEENHYSWWSYRANARARNVGWRIDYHCVNKGFISNVKQAKIRPEVMGADHCPVEIEL